MVGAICSEILKDNSDFSKQDIYEMLSEDNIFSASPYYDCELERLIIGFDVPYKNKDNIEENITKAMLKFSNIFPKTSPRIIVTPDVT
jgi:hypothetical protein